MAVDLERQTHNNARGNNFDGLDKAFVIFKLPANRSQPRRLHRRVDLIVAPHYRYSLAVLGWSGSMIFERDLRYVLWLVGCHFLYRGKCLIPRHVSDATRKTRCKFDTFRLRKTHAHVFLPSISTGDSNSTPEVYMTGKQGKNSMLKPSGTFSACSSSIGYLQNSETRMAEPKCFVVAQKPPLYNQPLSFIQACNWLL
jgi:hypothetical protein